jgi:hypothetical protein
VRLERGVRREARPLLAVIIRHRVSPSGEPDDRLQRMIQYSREVSKLITNSAAYWIARSSRAMTAE